VTGVGTMGNIGVSVGDDPDIDRRGLWWKGRRGSRLTVGLALLDTWVGNPNGMSFVKYEENCCESSMSFANVCSCRELLYGEASYVSSFSLGLATGDCAGEG
jgi:hypothetical protein